MKIKVKKITNTKMVDRKDGNGQFPVNQILTDDDEVLEIIGSVKVGDELEGEIKETQFGKRFEKTKTGFSKFGRSGNYSDPDTMLISYAKDITTQAIEKGLIKTNKDAAQKLSSWCELMFQIFDKRKQGKSVVAEPVSEEEKIEVGKTVKKETAKEDEVDVVDEEVDAIFNS